MVSILSKAFDENRSVNYVVRQDQKRVTRIGRLMEYSFNVCLKFGEVWLSDNERGCALILFPDRKRTTFRSILWDLQLAFFSIGLLRVGKVLGREARIKAFHPKEPFCYLWFIGVQTEDQGKGTGSSLLKDIIDRCETIGHPIYLETSVKNNLPWYRKFGFEIYNTIEFTYTLYLLRRNPPQ